MTECSRSQARSRSKAPTSSDVAAAESPAAAASSPAGFVAFGSAAFAGSIPGRPAGCPLAGVRAAGTGRRGRERSPRSRPVLLRPDCGRSGSRSTCAEIRGVPARPRTSPRARTRRAADGRMGCGRGMVGRDRFGGEAQSAEGDGTPVPRRPGDGPRGAMIPDRSTGHRLAVRTSRRGAREGAGRRSTAPRGRGDEIGDEFRKNEAAGS